jgi:hypothetical protein
MESPAQRAVEIRQQYAELEQAKYGRSWTKEEFVQGFVGDVGVPDKALLAAEEVGSLARLITKSRWRSPERGYLLSRSDSRGDLESEQS